MDAPRNLFNDAWNRCDILSAMYAYLSCTTSGILNSDELLRSEWVGRVAALDLYIHELIAQRMLEIFEGRRTTTDSYNKFMLPNGTIKRIRESKNLADAGAAFDLEVRRQLGLITYQGHESIANGIRMISSVDLWNGIADFIKSSSSSDVVTAKNLRFQLSMITERRNKIAHEGDMQPSAPRIPWPICQADLKVVSDFILKIVSAIESII